MLVLGMTEREATGEEPNPSTSLFDARDLARMEQAVKFRKEVANLVAKLRCGRRRSSRKNIFNKLAGRPARVLTLVIGPVPIARRRRRRAPRRQSLHEVPWSTRKVPRGKGK